MSESSTYCGVVDHIILSGPRGSFAQIRVIAEATSDNLSWQPIDGSVANFPNQGFVTWFAPPSNVTVGSLWQFDIEEQPSFDPYNRKHDQFRVKYNPTSVRELLDLRGDNALEYARQLLTEDGILLPFVPAAAIYIWAEEATWIGPLQIVRHNDKDVWLLDTAVRQNYIPCVRPLPPSQVAHLREKTTRLILGPAAQPGPRTALLDWSPDELLLKRVLRLLRRTDQEFAEAVRLTDKVIERAIELLGPTLVGKAEHELQRQQFERARAVIGSARGRLVLSQDLAADIFELPAVRALLQEEVDQQRHDVEAQVRRELTEAQEAAEAQGREQTRLQREIEALRGVLAKQAADLQNEIALRLEELLAAPSDALRDLAILRAALVSNTAISQVANTSGPVPNVTADSQHGGELPLGIVAANPKAKPVTDYRQLRKSLRTALRLRSVSTNAGASLQASLLAGAMPIIGGSDAVAALEACATSITGGQSLWLSISPRVLDPSDLLGRADAASRRFIPAAEGLLDLLLYATDKPQLFLVVLDGINRADVDSYLRPILASYTAAALGTSSPGVVLHHPASIAPEDPYAAVPRLIWPSNVLLAGTLRMGSLPCHCPPRCGQLLP